MPACEKTINRQGAKNAKVGERFLTAFNGFSWRLWRLGGY
jgi:hypothetical protein